jgi:hypothetical protein
MKDNINLTTTFAMCMNEARGKKCRNSWVVDWIEHTSEVERFQNRNNFAAGTVAEFSNFRPHQEKNFGKFEKFILPCLIGTRKILTWREARRKTNRDPNSSSSASIPRAPPARSLRLIAPASIAC